MCKLLVHTCCAPCFVYIHEDLVNLREVFNKDINLDITSLWYNPNIQPKFEYERRKQTLIDYCRNVNCKLDIIEEYNLKNFVENSINLDGYSCRCEYCYTKRLEKTFKYAKENNFDMVMTTLSISPYQNQDLIKKVGFNLEKKYGIKYIHLDYTKKFREGQNMARELGLYRQKYCGCVFSIDEGKWEY
ncbi:MAG: epoxyqueuosine reductase QueH [Clostridia bacterium]